MDKYKEYFEGGIFSSQGKLVLTSGEVYCDVVQINDVQDGKSFGKPLISLLTENDLGWDYSQSMDNKPKIDFFDSDFDHLRDQVWEMIKKSPNEIWLIITKGSFTDIGNLLPDDWEKEAYPNAFIILVNYEMFDDRFLGKNMFVVTSSDTKDFPKTLISNLDLSVQNSCLWIISGIEYLDSFNAVVEI